MSERGAVPPLSDGAFRRTSSLPFSRPVPRRLDRTRSLRTRLALLAAGLTLAFALGGMLAHEAWRASRDHRLAAERALRDYAGFAARSFRQHLVSRVYLTVQPIFAPIGEAGTNHPTGPLPDPSRMRAAAEEAERCACAPFTRPVLYARVDLRDSSLVVDVPDGRPPVTADTRAWLLSTALAVRDLAERENGAFFSESRVAGGNPEVLYLRARRGGLGIHAVYGFVLDAAAIGETLLRPAVLASPLFPVEATAGMPNDSLLSIAVSDSAGRIRLVATRQEFPPAYSATIPGGVALGGMRLHLALDPMRAPGLLVGGLPPSRLPLLIVLGALAAALLVAAFVAAWRAMRLARLREDFVAGVSHELRTPLAQILLFGETLQYSRMRSRRDVQGAATIIVGEARRLMQLVDNVLLFGRGAAIAAPHVTEPASLTALVSEVVTAFQPLAAQRGVTLHVVPGDDLVVPAERDAMRQVLLNLLDNAVKYGPAGQTVSIGVSLRSGRARLWVVDEGPGVPDADRERIWQSFVRLERERDGVTPGSGLGLAVVRDIIRRHSGMARVEEAPGGGACFIVELPGARPRDVVPLGLSPQSEGGEAPCAS